MNTFNHGWDYKPNQQKTCDLILLETKDSGSNVAENTVGLGPTSN
jgi:hypothetical protein